MYHFKKAHILKGNAGMDYPQYIIFFDTETFEVPRPNGEIMLSLQLGSATFWNLKDRTKTKHRFKTKKDFWDFVFKKAYNTAKLYLIAHNIPFDFKVLAGFDEMKNRDFKPHKIINAGTRNIWEFRNGRKTICCLDNMNFFTLPLEVLGDSIGLKKLEMPKNNLEALAVYCDRDVEIMVKAWELLFEFLKKNELGHFSKTIASQAFSAYRHRFMKEKIYIHNDRNVISMERAAYHGGRTECFKIGRYAGKFYLLDVNSMYPSVMRDYEYPVKLKGYKINPTIRQLENYLMRYLIIAEVTIKTDENVFPYKQNGKLIFPIGKFTAFLSSREIEYALENEMIVKIHKVYLYSGKRIFSQYVNFFYQKKVQYKTEKNTAFSYMTKLFLNSLYGKFGQRNEKWEKIPRPENKPDGVYEFSNIDTGEERKERVINGVTEITSGEKFEGYESFVAIPAHITADARMKLWNIIKTAGKQNVFYCDTDSVIVNTRGFKNCEKLIDENRIGSLGIKEVSDSITLYGAKDYIFNKEVIKGIKKKAELQKDGSYKQMRFEGFAGSLRNNRLNEMIIAPVVKHLKRIYEKGEVSSSGDVMPYVINENRLF